MSPWAGHEPSPDGRYVARHLDGRTTCFASFVGACEFARANKDVEVVTDSKTSNVVARRILEVSDG